MEYLRILKAIVLFKFITSILIPISVSGQVDCDTTNFPKILGNSYQCKWHFFKLNDTTKGSVVKHERIEGSCGRGAFASLTIIKVGNDTIRVLSLCNENEYFTEQIVELIPRDEPSFQVNIPTFINIPMYQDTIMITKKERKRWKMRMKIEQSILRSNEYDSRILKTTWAHIKTK